MHGLIHRSIEAFLREVCATPLWSRVAEDAGVDPRGFQTGRRHSDQVSRDLIATAARRLGKPESELLEDLGAWLAGLQALRRLLRFSGRDFREFLHRLDELPGRAHMVVPDLGLPEVTVMIDEQDRVIVTLSEPEGLWLPVLAGLIRAMADDYGALGVILTEKDRICVHVPLDAFTPGRGFSLGGQDPEVVT